MALPRSPGLTPSEVAFLCEMEMVTVIPRQRLEGLELLGGPTLPLQPPHRTPLPLWLALLLKRQNRANIFPPPWLHPSALERILILETKAESGAKGAFTEAPPLPRSVYGSAALSPPFVNDAIAEADERYLPYHWLEIGEILLEAASDDLFDAPSVRRLMRDLREVRMAKMRAGVSVLEGTGVLSLNGVGAMEVAEGRGFVSGVVDGLRRIGASREQAMKEREAEEAGSALDEDDDFMD